MNLVLLVYDSVRPDFLGCYGNDEINTLVLNKLAEEGVKFNNVITSSSWTLPSVSSIITGIYSHKLGLFKWDQPLDNDIKTLFHYFKENHYEVGSFVFDEKYLFSAMPFAKVQGHSRNFDNVCNWIKQNVHKNFFLFVHNWRTHIPWQPKNSAQEWRVSVRELQKLLRENGSKGIEKCKMLYKKAIEEMSEVELAKIIETLKETGILEETLIIFTSDHGESWGERISNKSEITDNFALHGRFLYQESLRVPLILRLPKFIPLDKTIKTQIRSIDIFSTILDLFQFEEDMRFRKIDGKSLVSLINCDDEKDRMGISSTTDSDFNGNILDYLTKIAVVIPTWKLIWSIRENRWELYNLKEDQYEQVNVIRDYPDIRRDLESTLKQELRYIPERRISEEDKECMKRQLQGLGYL